MIRSRRNQTKITLYKEAMQYECSNPYCPSGLDIEVHHVIPVRDGGPDKYWNYISLCHRCHRSMGMHRNWEFLIPILFSWKCKKELEILGFVLDEESENYHKNIKELLKIVDFGYHPILATKLVETKSHSILYRKPFYSTA